MLETARELASQDAITYDSYVQRKLITFRVQSDQSTESDSRAGRKNPATPT